MYLNNKLSDEDAKDTIRPVILLKPLKLMVHVIEYRRRLHYW